MYNRKEIKKHARHSLKEHYGIWVILCAIAMILAGEEIFTNSLSYSITHNVGVYESKSVENSKISAVLSNLENDLDQQSTHGLITQFTGFSKQFTDILIDLSTGNIDESRELANQNIQNSIEQSKTNQVLGRSRGILSDLINRISSGSFIITIGVAIASIVGSDSAAAIILVLLGLVFVFVFQFLVINTYKVLSARMFLEGRIYDVIHTNRTLFLIRTNSWLQASTTMFVVSLYQALWNLTIIGGIIKHYSYFLVPYIVAENPKIHTKTAIQLSKEMMKGHKLECFQLELSFIGWELLNLLTFGISKLLYVRPYQSASYCEYYAFVRSTAKQNHIKNIDLLNDDYLYVKPEIHILKTTYQDVISTNRAIKRNPTKLTGIYLFLAKNFGLTLRNTEAERDFEKEQIEKQLLFFDQEMLATKVYPTRLCPTPDVERRQTLGGTASLKCYSVWSLILMFFFMSITGWVFEVAMHLVTDGDFVNRGILHGPWLPIYGVGTVLILLMLYRFRNNPLQHFFLTILVCGSIEYFTSYYLETTRGGKRWWDYTGYFLNIHGRICAEGLLAFGLGGIMIVYFLAPTLDNFIRRKLKPSFVVTASLSLMILFATDQIYSRKYPNEGDGITSYESKIETPKQHQII